MGIKLRALWLSSPVGLHTPTHLADAMLLPAEAAADKGGRATKATAAVEDESASMDVSSAADPITTLGLLPFGLLVRVMAAVSSRTTGRRVHLRF